MSSGGGKQPGPVNQLLTQLWSPTPAFFFFFFFGRPKIWSRFTLQPFCNLPPESARGRDSRNRIKGLSFFGNFKEHILMIIFYRVHRVGFSKQPIGSVKIKI